MKRKIPVIILECANSHDGNYKVLTDTVNFFSKISYKNLAIKFQPFSASTLATKDYKWFKTYQILEFKETQWRKILELSKKKYKYVLIDIFDEYSLKILRQNLKFIDGIKLQSSILENKKILFYLQNLKIENKKLILNISGKSIQQINIILENFKKISNKIILQCGYQDYPTEIKETNFNKVIKLNSLFPNYELSYADHLDSKDIRSLFLPIKAIQNKCSIIEKHISLRGKKSKYDNYSSLNFQQIENMINNINFFLQKDSKNFISKRELLYLKNTIQAPVAIKDIKKNNFLNFQNFSYLRTNHNSNKVFNIELDKNYIALKNISKNEMITKKNLKKIKIGVLIACRLKSTRLKNKALLKLTKKHTLIDKCILSSKNISQADEVILATSRLKEDQILGKFCKKHSIKFYGGSPNNVLKRYVDASKKYKIDLIVRVTGDCPEISSEITERLIKKHIQSHADYTVAKNTPPGFGVEIINPKALYKIHSIKKKGEMSEYMTYYFLNNKKKFKINFVTLPKKFKKNYRMSIDYPEDLKFFRKLYDLLKKNKIEMNMENLNYIINKNKNLLRINNNRSMIYKSDKNLINKIKQHTLL